MHLVSATKDFKILNQPKAGFPILLWEDMRSCRKVNEFFRSYLMSGNIGSKGSWTPIGRSLYDYFGFLEAHELAWDDVDRGDGKNLVTAYRDYCFEDCKLARGTVGLRLVYICAFYDFARRRNWIKNLPYEYEDRFVGRTRGQLAHVDASGGRRQVRSIMPRRHQTLPKFLNKNQVEALLGAATNPHHQVIIRLALQSGLRREELATFPLVYVFDPIKAGIKTKNLQLVLDTDDGTGMKTKGSKKRVIYISCRLMRDLYHYAVHWRGERASLSDRSREPLFLNQSGAPWAAGGKGIEAMVRNVGARVGIKTHPHMLRHTYATRTLVALQRHRGDTHIEPIVFLQKQLGHESVMHTMLYLHLVNELADDAVLAYDDELNDWIEGNS